MILAPPPAPTGRFQPMRTLCSLALAATAVLLLIAPTLIALFRHSPPLLAIILAVLLAIPVLSLPEGRRELGKHIQSIPHGALFLASAGFLLWLAFRSIFSPVHTVALGVAAQFLGGIVLAVVLAILARIHQDDRLLLWLLWGVLIAAVVVSVDAVSFRFMTRDESIRQMIGLTPRESNANRAVVLMTLLVPFMIVLLAHRHRERWLVTLALAASLLAIVVSHSESAKAALAIGLISCTLVHYLNGRGVFAIAVLSVTAVLTMPVIGGQAIHLLPKVFYDATNPGTFEIRAHIWESFTAHIWDRPIFGTGIESSRIVISKAGNPIGLVQHLNNHPHNAILQIWFELGLVGVALLSAVIGIFLRRTEDIPIRDQVVRTALFGMIFTVSCVSHGAWQAWWPCLIGIVLVGYPRAQSINLATIFPHPLRALSGLEYARIQRRLLQSVETRPLIEYRPASRCDQQHQVQGDKKRDQGVAASSDEVLSSTPAIVFKNPPRLRKTASKGGRKTISRHKGPAKTS